MFGDAVAQGIDMGPDLRRQRDVPERLEDCAQPGRSLGIGFGGGGITAGQKGVLAGAQTGQADLDLVGVLADPHRRRVLLQRLFQALVVDDEQQGGGGDRGEREGGPE